MIEMFENYRMYVKFMNVCQIILIKRLQLMKCLALAGVSTIVVENMSHIYPICRVNFFRYSTF